MNKLDKEEEALKYLIKHGLRETVNKESTIGLFLTNNNPMINNKLHYHEFPEIVESILKEGAITQYDIPQYIRNIPEGFSNFCTTWEAVKVKQYMENYNISNAKKKDNISINKEIQQDIFQEPVPKNDYCHLCYRKFDDYLEHVNALGHKNYITKNPLIIDGIKNTFKRIINFWEEKYKLNSSSNNIENSCIKDLALSRSEINRLSSSSSSTNCDSSSGKSNKLEESSIKEEGGSFKKANGNIIDILEDEDIEKDINQDINKDINNEKKLKIKEVLSTFHVNSHFSSEPTLKNDIKLENIIGYNKEDVEKSKEKKNIKNNKKRKRDCFPCLKAGADCNKLFQNKVVFFK